MSPTVQEIRQTAEARLRELEPLLDEADQLRSLLAAIDSPVHLTPASPPARRRPLTTVAPQRPQRDGRAPQGANKRLILDVVAARPGVAAPQIAAATGLKRTVVASTVSRLKRVGELEAHGAGVRLPGVTEARLAG